MRDLEGTEELRQHGAAHAGEPLEEECRRGGGVGFGKARSARETEVSATEKPYWAIREAMAAANPDEKGSLMRELDARGVGDLIRAFKT